MNSSDFLQQLESDQEEEEVVDFTHQRYDNTVRISNGFNIEQLTEGFIFQPEEFDASHCRGRCPPRYHPLNDHSLLQVRHSKLPKLLSYSDWKKE